MNLDQLNAQLRKLQRRALGTRLFGAAFLVAAVILSLTTTFSGLIPIIAIIVGIAVIIGIGIPTQVATLKVRHHLKEYDEA